MNNRQLFGHKASLTEQERRSVVEQMLAARTQLLSDAERKPRICRDEVDELTARYGAPQRCNYVVQADEYIYSYRWRRDSDRRAEVVFAIQDETGKFWVHSKRHYPANLFRLPSGGIHWDEPVEHALLREVHEETNLSVQVLRFLALLEYRFFYAGSMVTFASYVFHLSCANATPVAGDEEPISAFRAVLPAEIPGIAADLRGLPGERRAWGRWRALVHDVVYDCLTN